ncbi:hypothetical protein [Litorimonas haliclonae]|uniref:hypothetical protein n=1 Tax=Litorimonas haliclonae TaxID=2081977 RepID=UPI0039F0EEC1
MASRRERRALKALLESGNDKTREAFLEAVADIVDGSDVQRIIRALERNDLDGALRALNIQDEAFQIVAERVAETYVSGGRITAQGLSAVRLSQTGLKAIIRFDARNLEAERWLADMSSRLVTRIAEGQRQTVRETLRRGLEAGDNPRRTALDIVGRVQRGSNRRSGGILGLTKPQEQALSRARENLRLGKQASSGLICAGRNGIRGLTELS